LNAIGIAMDIKMSKEIGLTKFLSNNNFFIRISVSAPLGMFNNDEPD
jgi:hypothetical protein